jgi:hypothetical protein
MVIFFMWIRKELVNERRVRPEDCYPVSRSYKFDRVLTTLSSSELRGGSRDQPSFAEVLRKPPMVDGGR